MQIPPGDASSSFISAYLSRTNPAPRQVPDTPPQPQEPVRAAAPDHSPSTAPNSPPPVERAHSVERIAHGTVPRDIPCGSLVDICA